MLVAIFGALVFATAVARAGRDGSITVSGLPLFTRAGAFAFLVHWVVFLPSLVLQTEHFYDLTGSLTYLTVIIGTLLFAGNFDARSILLTRVSGIPIVESRARERWGGDPEFKAYRDKTPLLFPQSPR